MIRFRQQYDEAAAEEVRAATRKDFSDEESLTQQQFVEEADINVLVRRFGLEDAPIPPAAIDPRFFGDMSDIPDLRTAMDRVREANDRFMSLPAELRARFGNSPAQLWEFVNDPANVDDAVRMGLLARRAADPPSVGGQGAPASQGAPAGS